MHEKLKFIYVTLFINDYNCLEGAYLLTISNVLLMEKRQSRSPIATESNKTYDAFLEDTNLVSRCRIIAGPVLIIK